MESNQTLDRGGTFSTLEIHFLFFINEFREGTYPRKARGLKRVSPCGVLVCKLQTLLPYFFQLLQTIRLAEQCQNLCRLQP